MKARLFAVLAMVGLAVLIGYRIEQKQAENREQQGMRATRMKAPPVVSLSAARRQDIPQTFESVGTVEPPLSVKVAAKTTGRIDYLAVREGDRVAKGQVLVRIDPTEVEAQVRQAQAALAEAQYRLAQARITQNPTDVAVSAQVRQQQAARKSAQADHDQVQATYDAQVGAARADVSRCEADVASARANLENAQTRYQRLQQLFEKGYVSAQDVDDAKAAVGVRQAALDAAIAQRTAAQRELDIVTHKGKADIAAAAARLEQAQASLDTASANTVQKDAYRQSLAALQAGVAVAQAAVKSAQARRADTVLRSPLTGFVTARSLDPGAVATAGQPILTVQYLREVWVTVAVPEEAGGLVHLGQPAEVTLDSLPGRTLSGRLIQVNPAADPQSRQFTVRVALDNPDFAIKTGAYARVRITTGVVRSALVVPREAVQQGDDGPYVVVVDSDGIAHHRPVTLGPADVAVQAISAGLQVGEQVVTLGRNVRDGQQVRTGSPPAGHRGQGRRGARRP